MAAATTVHNVEQKVEPKVAVNTSKIGSQTLVLASAVSGEISGGKTRKLDIQPRTFKNITAKEREQMLIVWNKTKGKSNLNSSLSLELTREQQEELLKVTKPSTTKRFSLSQSQPRTRQQSKGSVKGSEELRVEQFKNNRRLSLPGPRELLAANALTEMPLSVTSSAGLDHALCVPVTSTANSAPVTTTTVFAVPTTTTLPACSSLTPVRVSSRAIHDQAVSSDIDNSMGKLRNGKCYSPSRSAVTTPKNVRCSPYNFRDAPKEKSEKRRQSTSPSIEPAAKKHFTPNSPLQLSDLRGCSAEMDTSVDSETAEGSLHLRSQSVDPQDFMSVMQNMMRTTLNEMKQHADELTSKMMDSVRQNEAKVAQAQVDLLGVTKSLNEFKQSQAIKFVEVDEKILGVQKGINNAEAKRRTVDAIVSDHSDALDKQSQRVESAISETDERLKKLEESNVSLQ